MHTVNFEIEKALSTVNDAILEFPWNEFDSLPEEVKLLLVRQFTCQIGNFIPYVKIPSGATLIRCRCNNFFESRDELKYRPSSGAPMGRMNLKDDSVFYSSLVDVTNNIDEYFRSFYSAHVLAVEEVSELFHTIQQQRFVKQKVSIGIWKTLSDIKVICPVGECDFMDRNNNPVLSFIKQSIQESDVHRKELLSLISRRIGPFLQCDTHDSNPNKYFFSAAFANYMLKYSRFRREGIIYPSMQGGNTQNCNVVLRPDIADAKLELAYIIHAVFYVADAMHAFIDPQVVIDVKSGTKSFCTNSNFLIEEQLCVSKNELKNFHWFQE